MVSYILFLLAPLLGGLLYGMDRIVRARMQNRIGPPLLQPYYDMLKLIDKKPFMIHKTHVVLAIMHCITLWISVGMILFGMHLLYIIFIHLLSSIFLILAGYSVRSSYSHIGANRELLSHIAYEPLLILIALGFYLQTGSFEITYIRQSDIPLYSLFLLLLTFILIIPIKLKKSPFDASEAHQEIVGGVEIEYSGIFFEFLYMAKWLEYIFVYLILFLFAGDSYIIASLLFLCVFFGINLIDNATARIRIDHLIKITLSIGLILSILNIIGLVYV